MMTGHVLFGGSHAEVMYQHQHAPLPVEQLKDVPQPVIVLLEVLLEKDPARRFQNPTELLKAMPTITGAVDAGRRITRQSLRKTPSTASRALTRRPEAILGPEKISLARLPVTGSDVFGREEDVACLDDAWANQHVNVVTVVAWAVSVSPRSSTIGSDEWLLTIIVLRSSFLGGPSTDRAAVGTLRLQVNSLTLLSTGLAIRTHGSEQRGERRKTGKARRASSNLIGPGRPEPSKIRLVHKKDAYVSLPSTRFCVSLPLLIRAFA